MATIEDSAAAFRKVAEDYRNLYGEIIAIKEDTFTAARALATAHGGDPHGPLPQELVHAVRSSNQAQADLNSAKAKLHAAAQAIEMYVKQISG